MRGKAGLLFTCLALVAACGADNQESTTTGDASVSLPATTVTTTPDRATTTAWEPGSFWVSETIVAASDAFAAGLGVSEATVAVVLALDNGYTFGQLLAAAAGTLSADGRIAGVDPDQDAYGLIADNAGPSAVGDSRAVQAVLVIAIQAADDSLQVTAKELNTEAAIGLERILSSPLQLEWEVARIARQRERAERLEERTRTGLSVLDLILQLSSVGYSFEQIVAGILFEEITLLKAPPADEGSVCVGLTEFGSDGSLLAIAPTLRPANGSSEACMALSEEFDKGENADILARTPDSDGWFEVGATTEDTTEAEVAPFPWTYEGTVRREQTYTATFGAGGSVTAVNEDRFEVTLFTDGSVGGVYEKGGNGSVFECSKPELAGTIYEGTAEAEVFSLDAWTHGDGEIIRPDGVTVGTYDADTMDLSSLSYSSTLGPIESCFNGTFTLEEAYLDATIPRVSPP